ncbi:FG-GAP-like repeat-containing protein, partial [Chitinimonas koreensis]
GTNVALGQSGSFSVPAADALLPVSIQPPHLANADAGTLPGEVTIGKGTAAYAMPLAVPPGTAGMMPELGLNYGSQSGNGPVGLGWELTGLSRIHRCGRTIAQGETMEGVRFNANDRLCLDGQRLILQSGTDYWAANAVYRSELDGFGRISRNGTGFKVEQRNGRIGYYGDTASSLAEAQGRTDGQAHSWAISRLEDRSGNRIDFEYQEDATTGEHLPLRIRWGGHASGLAHYARVDFAYEARPDADVAFLVGSHIDRRLRIKTLSTYTDTAADGSGGTLVRSYRLSYQQSPTSGRSMLRSVQACDGTGACLPATTFDWGEPDPAAVRKFNSIGTWQGPSPEKWLQKYMLDAFLMADFNGDGRSDLLERYQLNGVMPKLYLSNGSGFTVSTQFQGETGLFRVAELGDFDGDGQMDVLGADGEDKQSGLPDTEKYRNWRLCYSRLREGRNFECQALMLPAGQPTSLRMMRDFDGDGRTDMYWSGGGVVDSEFYQSGTQRVCLARGIANFNCIDVTGTNKVVPFGNRVPPYDTLQFSAENVDLDADGRSDAMLLEQPYVQNVEGMSLWGNIQAGVKSRFYPDPTLPVTEVSGTRTSLLFKYDNDRGWVVTGFSPFDYGSLSGDLNGDGYSDVLVGFGPVGVAGDSAGQGRSTARLCYGAAGGCGRRLPVSGYTLPAFTNAYVVAPGNLPVDNPVMTVGDFDRDGKPDFFTTLTGQTGLSVVDAQRYQLCRLISDGDYSLGQNMRCERWDMPDLPLPKRNFQNTPSNNWPRTFFGDFDGDGNQDIVIYRLNGQWEIYTAQPLAKSGQALDKLVRVTDGLGRISEIDYSAGNDPAVYSRVALDRNGTAIAHAYPKQGQTNVGQLVKALRVSNGQGDWLETRYKYAGAAIDLQGRGHLGFARIDATRIDPDTGAVITTATTWSSQDWPYIGMTTASRTTAANGVKLSDAANALDKQNPATGTVFPFVKQSTVVRLDLDGSGLDTTTTINTYGDGWGNLTQQDVTVSGGVTGGSKTYTAKTVTTYLNDATTWLIGRP